MCRVDARLVRSFLSLIVRGPCANHCKLLISHSKTIELLFRCLTVVGVESTPSLAWSFQWC